MQRFSRKVTERELNACGVTVSQTSIELEIWPVCQEAGEILWLESRRLC
jgi:hypothetical protein